MLLRVVSSRRTSASDACLSHLPSLLYLVYRYLYLLLSYLLDVFVLFDIGFRFAVPAEASRCIEGSGSGSLLFFIVGAGFVVSSPVLNCKPINMDSWMDVSS